MTELVLDFAHLTKRYGRNVVVDDLSFVVEPDADRGGGSSVSAASPA